VRETGETKTRRLGVLLATAEDHPNTETVLGLARASLARGHEVLLYLLDEGVRNLTRDDVASLGAEPGVRLYSCAHGSRRRGVASGEHDLPSGLYVLYSLLRGADRFVAFT
jgi:sulfur relay (sulfurtransferase) complex TusBCD TusD component (DsrE family)